MPGKKPSNRKPKSTEYENPRDQLRGIGNAAGNRWLKWLPLAVVILVVTFLVLGFAGVHGGFGSIINKAQGK